MMKVEKKDMTMADKSVDTMVDMRVGLKEQW